MVIHARSDHPYGTKIAVIKASFLWFMRCCNGTQELISITNNFISKLQKIGYDVEQMWKTAKEMYSITEKQKWPYIVNPSIRIQKILGIQINKKEKERTKYLRMEWSRNLKDIDKMMTRKSKYKPAYAFGRKLKSRLTNSEH